VLLYANVPVKLIAPFLLVPVMVTVAVPAVMPDGEVTEDFVITNPFTTRSILTVPEFSVSRFNLYAAVLLNSPL
jgi:hypothetical protein